MKYRDYYDSGLAWNDMLFCMLASFITLFLLAASQMRPADKTPSPDVEGEYLITIVWPRETGHDVDLYVEDPLGNIAYFNAREVGMMHLHRDDLGHKNDSDDGELLYDENQESLTIRKALAGEYVVNVHMYYRDYRQTRKCPVTVRLEKVKPNIKIIEKTVYLNNNGDEKTAFRFKLGSDGEIISVINGEDLPKNLTGNAKDISGEFPE